MKIFKLPDLGEGIEEAELTEWLVKEGDQIQEDDTIAIVETDKASVEVPAPHDGIIEKLFYQQNDTIKTGAHFVGFKQDSDENSKQPEQDAGTVVGEIKTATDHDIIDTDLLRTHDSNGISPAVKALARKLGVDLGQFNQSKRITKEDIRKAATQVTGDVNQTLDSGFVKQSLLRRSMAINLSQSNQQVAQVTTTEDANISAWFKQEDITYRLICAIRDAVTQEPIMNSFYNGNNFSVCQLEDLRLGIAVDTPAGLFVPVISNVNELDEISARHQIEEFKIKAEDKSFTQEDLHEPSIILSNFGSFAGKYATPMVLPPTVCIVGLGVPMRRQSLKIMKSNPGHFCLYRSALTTAA